MDTRRSFDPDRSWTALDERLEAETNPRIRALLTQVRDHMRSEIGGDLERLMATLCDEPQYHLWGLPVEAGPKGRSAVESFYTQMIESGGHRFEFAIDRIVADRGAVVTEGRMLQRISGTAAIASGIERLDDAPVDPDGSYLSETQLITVWPASPDGRLRGEDIYLGSPPLARLSRLDDAT
jgi:hypothetical protein